MFRRLFYAAACVSAILLVATLIVWPVSHYRDLYAYYDTAGGDEYLLAADSGRALVRYISGFDPPRGWHFGANRPQWSHWSYGSWGTPDPDLGPGYVAPTFLGVCLYYLPPGRLRAYHGASVPFSYLTLLFSILPLLAFRSIRRRRRDAMSMRGFPVTTVEQTPKE